jgi:D-amino-acid dehydrogenase
MRIAVVGGGVAGASVAFHAAGAGADVVLIDQGHDGQATAAGAGIICPWTSSVDNPDHYRLAAAGAAYYPELIDRLGKLGQTTVGYRRTGVLCLAADTSDAAQLEGLVRQRAEHDTGAGEISRLSGNQACRLFPLLRDDLPAVRIAGGARVDGRLLRDALRNAAIHNGAEVVCGHAELIIEHRRAVGVRVNGTRHDIDVVVAAAGAWTPHFLQTAPATVELAPQRGQIVHLAVPQADTSSWPVVQPPNRHYLVPFDDARVVAGATRESGSGFDSRVTAGGLSEILQHALDAAPGLADAGHCETRVGLRPLSADGLPYLGWLPDTDGVAVATGFGPTGLTMAPVAGKLVADLVTGRRVGCELGAYDPGR